MKFLLILSMCILGSQSWAARDSVAVFYRPEKVVVLVNEAGTNSRLQNWLNGLQVGKEIYAQSADKSITVDCGRNERAVSCQFRFLPSDLTSFGERRVEAQIALSGLQLTAQGDSEISFESDRQDRFVVQIANGTIHFHAEKKIFNR